MRKRGDEPVRGRRPYEKPRIMRFPLAVAEVLATDSGPATPRADLGTAAAIDDPFHRMAS